jgi:cytochrome c-type biogenesis protein CcmH/NrfG
MPFPYIFTFYSFKGGVGRSMALMNVAYTLAGRGRHVLVVDMDLEAPGLSGFLDRTEEFAVPEAAHPKDVLTLLGEATRALPAGGTNKEKAQSLPPLSHYIRSVADEKLAALQPKLGKLGRLDVLGTDQKRDYMGRLANMGLKDLPQEQLIALSSMLHHYFKTQTFPHRPLGVESFEPALPTHYDYVLVDSRTGITETGGLCVGPLSDRLVVVTGLNDQNVEGTLTFLNEVGIRPKPRSKEDEPWDDADTVRADNSDNPSLGPKPTILVASPVPYGEIAYKRQRLDELEKRLGIRSVSLSYHPQMALMESVFVRDYQEEYLAVEYDRLATTVMAQVGDDPQHLALESSLLWNEKKEYAKAIACVLRVASHSPQVGVSLLTQLGGARPRSETDHLPEVGQLYAYLSQIGETRKAALNNWGNALAARAKTKAGEEADRLFGEAGRKFGDALRLTPDHETMSNWGVALSDQADTKSGEEADRLFDEAGRKFDESLRLKPDFHEALNNWGATLSGQAKTKSGEAADRLFDEAGRKFDEAFRLKPDYHVALTNWGNALHAQAEAKTGEEADRLFEEAGNKYAEALRLKADSHAALSNWGSALTGQAKTKSGEAADRLFEEAAHRYAEALRLKPDLHMTCFNWGSALSDQAKTKSGEEADRLFDEAGRKFAESLRLKPDFHAALSNWGNALVGQAETKTGEESDRLFEEAANKYAEALRLKPDDHAALFNWATALSDQAKTKVGEVADRLFAEAGRKFAEALRLKPYFHMVPNNWGNALSAQAQMKSGEEADRLFDEAGHKYAEALRLKPDFHEALFNWGNALSDQAKTKTGEEADRLFEEAGRKHAEALGLKPDLHVALINWGAALIERASMKSGEEAAHLLRQARQKLLEAERIRAGSGAYNLACIEAMEGSTREAVHWLQVSESAGERLSRTKIAAEKTFDRVRNQPEFISLVESLAEN